MRIISDFHDYYDTAMGLGQDRTRIYNRKWEEIDDPKMEHVEGMPSLYFCPEKVRWPAYGKKTERLERYTLFFCGKRYPFYSRRVANEIMFSFEHGFATATKRPIDAYQNWQYKTTKDWQGWLEEQSGKDCTDINIAHNCPIILLHSRHINYPEKFTLHYNPPMKQFHLQKLIDPFTAYQELDMFVGGVLTQNMDGPAAQTDKEKVMSHGFDPKYGFRKMPVDKSV